MFKKMAATLVTLAILLGGSHPAAGGIWPPMSDDDLIDSSELIVVGRIVWIENGEVSTTSMDTARILVDEVLKGDPTTVMAPLVFPGSNRGRRTWTGRFESTRTRRDISFDLNQEGIWFLRRARNADEYRIDNPARFKPLFFKDRVMQAIAARR